MGGRARASGGAGALQNMLRQVQNMEGSDMANMLMNSMKGMTGGGGSSSGGGGGGAARR